MCVKGGEDREREGVRGVRGSRDDRERVRG